MQTPGRDPLQPPTFPAPGMNQGLEIDALPSALATSGLRKRFGKVEAVAGIDLRVPEGQVYGFLGRNGAGKTTTIRMLMGIVAPDGGEIELLGAPGRRITAAQKRRIGYVSQGQHFYPWMSCRYIGRFVGSFYPSWSAEEYARLLGVLDLPPERKVAALSQGMKVKLALALALAHRPALLILDEPTSGLDPVARREFLAMIRQQARDHQRTTFFSSHLVEEVERIADCVGIIDRGRLRYQGGIAELREGVRLVTADAIPSDGEVLTRDDAAGTAVVRARPEAWAGVPATAMTLEDIFIALTGGLSSGL